MNPLHETERVICWGCQLSLPQTDHPWDFQIELWEKMNKLLGSNGLFRFLIFIKIAGSSLSCIN